MNLHNGADPTTVPLPHAPETRLAPDVPQLEARRRGLRRGRRGSDVNGTRVHCLSCFITGNTNLDGDVALCDLPHVETNCGNHVFAELARLKHTHRCVHLNEQIHKVIMKNTE